MKISTILREIFTDQLESLFAGLRKQLDDIKQNLQPKLPTEWLTRNEVVEMRFKYNSQLDSKG